MEKVEELEVMEELEELEEVEEVEEQPGAWNCAARWCAWRGWGRRTRG